MSRSCEIFAGGNNGFKIKNVEGYKKWKETLEEDEADLLHEKKDEFGFHVYVGFGSDKDLYNLDTYINYFHPYDEVCDWGSPTKFWAGLSLFTEEPIELFQTDEEFPFLTKVFGNNKDDGMYRVYAKDGEIIVQLLGFIVVKEEKHKKEELFEAEDLEFIERQKEALCDKCSSKIPFKFKFEDRGYYEEINKKHKYKKLCEKCYKELKIPFAEMRKLECEIEGKKQDLTKLKEGLNSSQP